MLHNLPFVYEKKDLYESERVFSPQVMKMNVTALLRFIKLNCSQTQLHQGYLVSDLFLLNVTNIEAEVALALPQYSHGFLWVAV